MEIELDQVRLKLDKPITNYNMIKYDQVGNFVALLETKDKTYVYKKNINPSFLDFSKIVHYYRNSKIKMPKIINYWLCNDESYQLLEYEEGIVLGKLLNKNIDSALRELADQLYLLHNERVFINLNGFKILNLKSDYSEVIEKIPQLIANPDYSTSKFLLMLCHLCNFVFNNKMLTVGLCHNDLNLDNILLKEYNGEYHFNCFIDLDDLSYNLPGEDFGKLLGLCPIEFERKIKDFINYYLLKYENIDIRRIIKYNIILKSMKICLLNISLNTDNKGFYTQKFTNMVNCLKGSKIEL